MQDTYKSTLYFKPFWKKRSQYLKWYISYISKSQVQQPLKCHLFLL